MKQTIFSELKGGTLSIKGRIKSISYENERLVVDGDISEVILRADDDGGARVDIDGEFRDRYVDWNYPCKEMGTTYKEV